MDSNIAFIGAGKIAEAWIGRLINSGTFSAVGIMACDPSDDRLKELQGRYPNIRTSTDNAEGACFGQVVVLATPSADVLRVLAQMGPSLPGDTTVISLVAGVSLGKLTEAVRDTAILRIMPNTASLVGEGMNLACFGPGIPHDRRKEIESLLSVFGRSLEIDERDMEAWGALCAVGPTFLFPTMESLIVSAVDAGLPEPLARMATAQVFIGAGRLATATERSITELNNMIGLHTLAEQPIKQLIADAYKNALEKLEGLARRMAATA